MVLSFIPPGSSALLTALLPYAIVFMVLALSFYSIGVWGAQLAHRLCAWQLAFFWGGFVCDTAGTALMGKIAGSLHFDLHTVTGMLAIALMALHAVWATAALALKKERVIRGFHRFSITVWTIWLVPFFGGLVMAMRR